MAKNKLMIIIISIFLLILIAAVGMFINKSKEEKELESILKEGTTFVNLQEAREQMIQVMEKAKDGTYRNMKFKEFIPVITEENYVAAVTVTTPNAEMTVDSIDNQVKVLETFFGENLDTNFLYDNMENLDLETLKEKVANGTYSSDFCFLLYMKDEYYGQVDNGINSLWIDKGIEGVTPSVEKRIDKEYYVASSDGSLEDTYNTSTGEMSVKEAIQAVETYFNEEFPIEINNQIQYKVIKVWVLEKENGEYAFEFGIRRAYKGVGFEYAIPGTFAYGEKDSIDMITAYMEGKDNILFFNGLGIDRIVEETETYEKIISPEKALAYVSEKIGNESTYEITGMELSYTTIEIDGETITESTPVWMIFAINETTDQATRFYVDVITGEVSARIM